MGFELDIFNAAEVGGSTLLTAGELEPVRSKNEREDY